MRLFRSCLLCILLAGCGGSAVGPEEALRAWVATAVAAAEDKDRRKLLSMVSEHYADRRGNDREAIDRTLRVWFLRQDKVVLVSKIDKIDISADTAAEVEMTVGMAGTDDSALGLRADAYRFGLELVQNGGEWLLIGARWGELGEEMR
jgi:hypothetical protein